MLGEDVVNINLDSTFLFIDGYILNACKAARDSIVSYYRLMNLSFNFSDILNNIDISHVIINEGNSKDTRAFLDALYRCDHANILPRPEEVDMFNNIHPFSDSYTETLENSLKIDITRNIKLLEPSMLDSFPNFTMLIKASKMHHLFTTEITIDIHDQLESLSDESDVIMKRLQSLNDPFVQTTLSNYPHSYNEVIQIKEHSEMLYGGENYHSNFLK